MSEFYLRPFEPKNEGEEAYFFNKILLSFRQEGKHALDTDNESFKTGHHKVIESLLRRGANAIIASPVGEPGICAGLMLSEPNVLHYVYTTLQYRRAGIAMQLINSLEPAPRLFTHRTRSWSHIERRLRPMEFAPYLITWPHNPPAWLIERQSAKERAEREKLHRSRMQDKETKHG